ncbi:Survival of motor neuron protein-interacting protein yip12 [Wickerhamiella sorbophila]|uniref:Survival of motor neuron protein-interacting protein yip12 n=1 Tax=Wickerhamiella sorbophila TaxID=45607 RepID=A0A2T0FCR8_9ASCO|nr:Survival of motor neuron protein-interacting protein yip12 [Wickerhamiella sorbophila]PRT52798.1 Survival of motor neuron protein-interacting protein yip12 [Wickerhamiella sorbophila]
MPTSGRLDPQFGQRSAFPIESDIVATEGEPTNGVEYVLKVRQEAEEMAQRVIDSEPAVKRIAKRPASTTPVLDYDESADYKVFEYTKQALGVEGGRTLLELYARGREVVNNKDIEPCDCDSQATWKEYIQENPPLTLDHSSNLRVIKYLARWGRQRWTVSMAHWAWITVIRLPEVLTADEIALLRDLVRADETEEEDIRQFLDAIRRIAVDQFGQADLRKQ